MVRRMANLFERLRWLTPLAGNTMLAFCLICRVRSNPEGPHEIRYSGHRIFFRAQDEQVLREVLAHREYGFAAEWLKRSRTPIILDIGAHIGAFALWCLGEAPAARIVCVEANPRTSSILRDNVRLWSSSGRDLRVEHAAAGAQDGDTLWILEPSGASMSARIDGSGTMAAPSLSLPTLLELSAPGGKEIDLAKIDIEGSEEALLCSHPEALKRVRALIVELHPTLCNEEKVRAVLRDAYPSVVEAQDRISTKPLLYCHRDGRSTTPSD